MSTRTPFIAPVVDIAAQFIKKRGAITVSELAVYLSAAGLNVSGDAELTGEELMYLWPRRKEAPALPVIRSGRTGFAARPVIASGRPEFVRTIAALLVNRTVDLDATNPALIKLTWDGPWDAHFEASTPVEDESRTAGHYHILIVRDPGGSQQVAECDEAECRLDLLCCYLDEVWPYYFDEGWDAIWIIECGPERCRRNEICNLPVQEWGEPHWVGNASFPALTTSSTHPTANWRMSHPSFAPQGHDRCFQPSLVASLDGPVCS